MRNLKKLLAVVVAICVLATFTVPAFAETKTDAQIATDLGVIKGAGGGVTADYLKTTPDRLQGAIMFLRLKGLEDTAKAFIGTDNFVDADGLNDTNQAILAYLKANPDLGFAGVGENKFSPLTKMTAKEYYKVMLVALGYEYEKDFTWANVLGFAASKGLTKNIDNDTFTVNDLCVATVEALKAPVKGSTDTLISKLVDGGSIVSATAVTSGIYTATPKTLEITSATADTLKTAKFVFNQELNSDTVKTDNFTGPSLKSVKLLDDKKTVIVVLADAKTEQSKTEDITVKNVKSAAGVTIVEIKKTVTFVDNTIPVISGAVAKNAKSIVISASEPMNAESDYTNSFDKVKIDGSTFLVATSRVDYAKNTVTLNLVTLLSVGAHKIEIGGLKDFANYTAVTQTYNFEVAADTTAPEIASAKVKSPNQIEVTFNEDVDSLNKGSFKINGEDAKSVAQDTDNPAKFTLDLTTALTIGATVEINVKYKDQQDVVGNKTAEKTYTFKVADDTALPTVTAAIGDKNKIILTFSKDVLKAGKLKVYKDDGTTQLGGEISLAPVTDKVVWENATVCKIANTVGGTGLNDTDAKDIKIKLTDVKDATVRANALAETVISLKAKDTRVPQVKTSYTVKQGTGPDYKDDTITFYFTEAMNADTLKSLSNYNVVTPVGTYGTYQTLLSYNDVSIKEVASDGKSVTIKAMNIYAAAGLGLGIRLDAMKDLADNMIVVTTVGPYSTVTPAVASVDATGKNKIEINFSSDIYTCDPGTFILKTDESNTTAAAAIVNTEISSNGLKVTATLDRDVATDFSGYLSTVNASKTKNAYGTAVTTTSGVSINDKIKPEIKGFTATNGGIIIEFSEIVRTTEANFINDLMLKKGSDPVTTITPGSIMYTNKDGNAANTLVAANATKYITIFNLEANKEYKISLYPRILTGTTYNTADVYGNRFVATTEEKSVTPKQP